MREKAIKTAIKYVFLFTAGGLLYNLMEIVFRGWSHWTMFFLGGSCFISLGLINEWMDWETPLWKQVLIGACFITVLEFLTGCIVNIWLEWEIWDYSGLPGNILGQICAPYFLLWLPVSFGGIFLDDCLRYWFFDEEIPHYHILK